MAEAEVELRSILDSAERAASAQDFASAEHYLRQAAAIQEAQLGPTHPELANTLNNLGIVFERLGKPADAETSYRRAYAIATTTLPPDDPLVMTSGQNLKDFCAASGRAFEVAPPAPVAATPPAPAPAPAAPSSPVSVTAQKLVAAAPSSPVAVTAPKPVSVTPSSPVAATAQKPVSVKAPRAGRVAPSPASRPVAPDTRAAAPAVVRSAIRAEPVATTSRRRSYLIWIGFASAIVILAFAWLTSVSRSALDRADTPPASAVAPAPPAETAAAAAQEPSRKAPGSVRQEPALSRSAPSAAGSAAETVPPAATVAPNGPPASGGPVSLVEAKLCRPLSLSDWQCTPATPPAAPGDRMFFYTRVKAGRDTTVQHRWYVNNGLLQSVNLRIRANSAAGFRTYSRNTVPAESRGTWRIELRDADGALLHEERFVVQ
jgi:Protein of unknown function (DUF2914)/Tetratricopeptide repeat